MSNHSIYLIAYPINSALEEKIDELLFNYDHEGEEDIYACCITEIPSEEAQFTMAKMAMIATEEDSDHE